MENLIEHDEEITEALELEGELLKFTFIVSFVIGFMSYVYLFI